MSKTVDAALLLSHPLPALPPHADKSSRGQVLVIAGGAGVPGAPLLTGPAALRAGAGRLQLAATPRHAVALGLAVPEAAIVPAQATRGGEISGRQPRLLAAARAADAVIIGPGMGDEAAAGALLASILRSATTPVVADAAALQGMAPMSRWTIPGHGQLILTPHPGEMATLTGVSEVEVRGDLEGAAGRLARSSGSIVVLKTEVTVIASPDGRIWRHDGGVSGLGMSGSGDVLAGVIGGLAARGAPPVTAALWGVWLHAQAGRRLETRIGGLGYLARELLAEIPAVLDGVDPTR